MNKEQELVEWWNSHVTDSIEKAYNDSFLYGTGFLAIDRDGVKYVSPQEVYKMAEFINEQCKVKAP